VRRCLLLVAVIAPLAACDPEESYQKTSDAQQTFDQVVDHLDKANSGVFDQAIDETGYKKSVEAYRHEQLKAANDAAAGLYATDNRQLQASAHVLSAEIDTNYARTLTREAGDLFASLSNLNTWLVDTASTIREVSHNAAEHEAISYDAILTKLRDQERTLMTEKEQLETTVKELEAQIAALNQQQQQASAKRLEKIAEADELARRAFKAKGQLAYDLSEQQSQALREADALTADADRAAATARIEQAKLEIARANLDAVTGQLTSIGKAMQDVQSRKEKTEAIAADSRRRVKELLEGAGGPVEGIDTGLDIAQPQRQSGFDENLERLTKAQSDDVDSRFAQAADRLNSALDHLDKAKIADPATHVHIQHAATQAELGHVYRQHAVITKAHHDLLQSLQTALQQAEPQRAQNIADAAQAAATRLEEAKTKATELLRAAKTELVQLADNATGPKADTYKRAALEHAIYATEALAKVTGEAALATEVSELRNKMHQIE